MKIIIFIMLLINPKITFASQNTNEMNSNIGSLIIFGMLFVIMYFLLIRPQTKKAKEHKNLIENLKNNDEVLTNSGIIGKIVKITDQFIILSLSENIEIIMKKESISQLLPKGTIKQIK